MGASIRPTLGRRRALDQRQVRLLDAPLLELAPSTPLGAVVARNHDQAAGVAIEPMDDARPVVPGDVAVRLRSAAREQRVDERAASVARRRDA